MIAEAIWGRMWHAVPSELTMLVGSLIERSRANGPGQRVVVWLQGCDRGCPGCCNPEFQPFESSSAELMTPSDLAERVASVMASGDVRGLTLSGGEPLHPKHREDLVKFLCELGWRCSTLGVPLDVMAFTGYTREKLCEIDFLDVLPLVDLLIAGPYVEELDNPSGIVASTNQEIVRTTDRFDDVTDDELSGGERIVEVHISPGGSLRITGLQSVEEAKRLVGL